MGFVRSLLLLSTLIGKPYSYRLIHLAATVLSLHSLRYLMFVCSYLIFLRKSDLHLMFYLIDVWQSEPHTLTFQRTAYILTSDSGSSKEA